MRQNIAMKHERKARNSLTSRYSIKLQNENFTKLINRAYTDNICASLK